jgi:hypothetical protein
MSHSGRVLGVVFAGLALAFSVPGSALAADLTVPILKAPPAPPSSSWWSTFEISGHIEAGVTFNPDDPPDGVNFGHLFTDKANRVLLNQALVTAQRPLDPKATGYDFGFKFQAMYGSDARYTHFLGEFDRSTSDINQFDIVEAHVLAHLPWLTTGGIDVKIGQYVTLEGAEVIYAPDNLLYSHSYIFNFGIPFKHTGAMTITHLNPTVDLYAGIDTGVNTTFGSGDNNKAAAFHGGIGLNNLLNGAVTVLATTHIGPENPDVPAVRMACACDPNSALRYLNDITITWKVNDNLTLITDLNYIRDDGFNVSGGGVAQYFGYKINDVFKVVGRAEIWADPNTFFVNAFPGNLDFVNSELGLPATVISGGKTTYGSLTLGLNITPEVPKGGLIKALIFRPEIRFDTSLNNTKPFDPAAACPVPLTTAVCGTKSSQFTIGGDAIVKF